MRNIITRWNFPTFHLVEVLEMPGILERNTVFEDIKGSIKADSKGRVILGAEFSGKNYRVSKCATGEILLTPVATIPERDMWLYKNPHALAMFHQGLADAAAGKVSAGEDFSRYADDTIEDE